MRTFIAIALPDPVRLYLKKLQDTLKKADADVKWVEPANIHLTMKFLGEIDEAEAETVKAAMREACAGRNVFCLGLSSLGGFPSSTSPRVVWMGISEGIVETKELAQRLEERLASVGKQEERPFAAHITIGRTRSGRNRRQLAEQMAQGLKEPPPPPFEIRALTLFKSSLSPKGPAYTPLFEAELNTP